MSVLFKNGLVVTTTGRYTADVYTEGDKITRIGTNLDVAADEVVDGQFGDAHRELVAVAERGRFVIADDPHVLACNGQQARGREKLALGKKRCEFLQRVVDRAAVQIDDLETQAFECRVYGRFGHAVLGQLGHKLTLHHILLLAQPVNRTLKHMSVQVIDETDREIVYTLRIKGSSFCPKIFKHGYYTIRVGDPDKGPMRRLKDVASIPQGKTGAMTIDFED